MEAFRILKTRAWYAVRLSRDSLNSTGLSGRIIPSTEKSPAKDEILPESVAVDGLYRTAENPISQIFSLHPDHVN